MTASHDEELRIAEALAREAGALVLRFRDGGDMRVELKAGDEPVSAADRASSAFIVAGLRKAFPDDIVISEESKDDARRMHARRVWYIDPIDGTKDFIRGLDGFSVMIGLCIEHRPVVGVVYQPLGDRMFLASPGRGAWLHRPDHPPRHLHVSDVDDVAGIRLVASKSHRGAEIDQVKSALGIDNELNIGSVGLKLSLIALGERDLYVNPAPYCKYWDTCAPEAILDAAGGTMTDLFGVPLRYDLESVGRPRGMIASNGKLHDRVVAKVGPLFQALAD